VGILRTRRGVDGAHWQGVHYRVLDVSTRVLRRGGLCGHEVVGGDGGESLSKVFLLFKPEIKNPKRGNTEFRIQMSNNPVPHVNPCISVVVIPT
jgi:hypothetical protein